MTNISYTHIILSKKTSGLLGYVELFIIRVKFAIYYFFHFKLQFARCQHDCGRSLLSTIALF